MSYSVDSITKEILICLPGQRLCKASETTLCGQGTYKRSGYIYASKSGIVFIEDAVGKKDTTIVNVRKPGCHINIPCLGDVVTARVLLTNSRLVKCAIVSVGDTLLESSYRGLLRKEDVRETEKDRTDIYKCFKPGDIIIARVTGQVEQSFLLSTAENELGVVIGYASDARHDRVPMVPLGWTEMQCPSTLTKEPRKVAKVLPESSLRLSTDVMST